MQCGNANVFPESSENGNMDMDGDYYESFGICVKIDINVWDFVLLVSSSLLVVFTVSFHYL